MPKIVVAVLTEKEVSVIEKTLSNASVHMTPAQKRDVTVTLGKIKKAQRVMV